MNTTPSTHHQHTPSTLHHQQRSSTQSHQHITTIYTTPSTQHHLHNIIHITPSTLHHHIVEGAALGALPSYPFWVIPADTTLVILRCGFFFVLLSLTYSTLGCPKTLLTYGELSGAISFYCLHDCCAYIWWAWFPLTFAVYMIMMVDVDDDDSMSICK